MATPRLEHQLSPVRPGGARAYIELLRAWTVRDLRAQYRRSALRAAWAIIQPAVAVAVVVFVFGVIFKIETERVPFMAYVLVGMVAFRFATVALSASTCLVDSKEVMAHTYFPREIVPLSKVLGQLVDLSVGMVGIVVVALIYGRRPTVAWLAAPVLLAILVAYAAAFTTLLATITVFVRDVQFLSPIVSQVLFFGSPISYEVTRLPEWLRWVASANPLAAVAEGMREVFLDGVWPRWGVVLPHLVVGLLAMAAAIWHLRSIEHRIVDLG